MIATKIDKPRWPTISQENKEIISRKSAMMAAENLFLFTTYTFPKFKPNWFHRSFYRSLQRFANGDIKKMMIWIPPQHGKTEGATRRMAAYLLGQNPDLKLAIAMYNSPKAKKINREIQRIIDNHAYREIFPDTRLNATTTTGEGKYQRNTDECEIVGHTGGFKTVGIGGGLTGDPVDILIIDDVYKDAMEAWSPVVRENVVNWYDTVAETRLHNDSKQLIVFTRWHEDDLAGRILKHDQGWHIVKYEAIKTTHPTEVDPRQIGEPLWPERHSLEGLLDRKRKNPHVFDSLYQQEPTPKEGLLYGEFQTYEKMPDTIGNGNYTDTADTGDDFLCSISYRKGKGKIYVTDLVYTQQSMDETEKQVPMMLTRSDTRYAAIESNAGGRFFATKVAKKVPRVKVTWFHQSKNKESRILTNAATVSEVIVMPYDWEQRWPIFAGHVRGYKAIFKANTFHDGPDVLTGIIEREHYGAKTSGLKRKN